MFNPTTLMIRTCIEHLQAGYCQTYGDRHPDYVTVMRNVAILALGTIARSDAPYHDVEHTILVTLAGQAILQGKQSQEGTVSPQDWLHTIVALLCHDLGYVQGVCQHDQPATRHYTTGVAEQQVCLTIGTTDASLTPYHVDRGMQVVTETLTAYPQLNLDIIQHYIDFTRFPVPADQHYHATQSYPALVRAADLIGQLSDPRYLQKLPALFQEFAETGTHHLLGYRHPADLRAGFPTFYHQVVHPLIQPALHYLAATAKGKRILANLAANVQTVEQEASTQQEEGDDRPPTLSSSSSSSSQRRSTRSPSLRSTNSISSLLYRWTSGIWQLNCWAHKRLGIEG